MELQVHFRHRTAVGAPRRRCQIAFLHTLGQKRPFTSDIFCAYVQNRNLPKLDGHWMGVEVGNTNVSFTDHGTLLPLHHSDKTFSRLVQCLFLAE